MANTSRTEHVRFRYGICLNDSCSKSKTKEVQQLAARKEFVCAECGKPLRECPPPKTWWQKHGKKVIAGGVAVVVLGGGAAYLGLSGGEKVEPKKPEPVVVEDSVKTDSVKVDPKPIDVDKDKDVTGKDGAGKTDGETTPLPPQPKTYKMGWATYEGPMQGGKPHGIGGTIKVTSHYSIDLKKASGEMLAVEPGDVIVNVKMDNGRLRQGELQRTDGTRKWISGL